MRIDGEWFLCADYVERPVIRGEALAADGRWVRIHFLVDTGADRTVFSAQILATLGLGAVGPGQELGGVGGIAQAVLIDSVIRLPHDGDGRVRLPGRYTAMTDWASLDMSVLGRDVTRHFVLIVDRPGNTICLINQQHRYSISPA